VGFFSLPEDGEGGRAMARSGGVRERKRARKKEPHPTLPEDGEGKRYLKISSVRGLSRKLLQELNRIGQLEMATICGISAARVM
jgi:hypothetical protein